MVEPLKKIKKDLQRQNEIMKDMQIGKECYISSNAQAFLGLTDGVLYTIVDILEPTINNPIVLKSEELGKDWVNFFNEDEIIIKE